MKHTRPFLEGTLILTISSLFARCIGFYNRIFLSNLIGAHQMGIYQLIFPIYLVGFSLCFHGFETALSKLVSALFAKHEEGHAYALLFQTIRFTLLLSISFATILFLFANPICRLFLKEEDCVICLRVALLALPFVGIKGCIHSYSIGLGKPVVSALSLCFEQVVRVASIYLIATTMYHHFLVPALIAVIGMVLGEIASCIFTITAFQRSNKPSLTMSHTTSDFSSLLHLGFPLTCNSLCVTLLSSIESILIPMMLARFYLDTHKAIALYGIATGMALPFVLFPSTITNALSVMLLPKVSAAYETKNQASLDRSRRLSIFLCLFLGIGSATFFYFFGNTIGTLFFHEPLCGSFLHSLAFLCPFLYLSSTLSSILNGMGKTKITLIHNVISLTLRIGFILLVVPYFGINGYILGLLTSSMVLVILNYKSVLNP